MYYLTAFLGVISFIGIPITLVVFLIQLIRKKKSKKGWGISTIACLMVFIICLAIPTEAPVQTNEPIQQIQKESSESTSKATEYAESNAMMVEGETTSEVMNEIVSDGIVEKLMKIGMTEEEANEGALILRQCGVPSIDICEPTDPNATIDELVAYRGKIDKDKIYWFTVENRKIFYVGFNGEDLYDEDKGGFLKNFNDVHIPETSVDANIKNKLRDLTETVLDKYFPYDTRYYDAWGIGREDNSYMVQCQISDGSILTDNWIFGRVWYELQEDGSFKVTGVKIGDKQYEIKK